MENKSNHPRLLPWHSACGFFVFCSPLGRSTALPPKADENCGLGADLVSTPQGWSVWGLPKGEYQSTGLLSLSLPKLSTILLMACYQKPLYNTRFMVLLVFISKYQAFHSHFLTASNSCSHCNTPLLLFGIGLGLPNPSRFPLHYLPPAVSWGQLAHVVICLGFVGAAMLTTQLVLRRWCALVTSGSSRCVIPGTSYSLGTSTVYTCTE